MNDAIVVSGSASNAFSKEFSRLIGAKLASVQIKRFPDDECYVKISDDLKNMNVFLVQTAYPDNNIIELFLLQDAIKRLNPSKITTIIPYMGYARQDKIFNIGEPKSSQKIAELIGNSCDKVFTIDIHEKGILNFFNVQSYNVSAIEEIGKYLKSIKIDIVIAPDKGAFELAKQCGIVAECEMDYLEKKRIDGHTVEITPKSLDVNGKSVAIVDDIISTGGTIIKASKELKNQGCKQVIAACTHGIFASNALDKLNLVCDKIISTDTIENITSYISSAPAVANHIIKN